MAEHRLRNTIFGLSCLGTSLVCGLCVIFLLIPDRVFLLSESDRADIDYRYKEFCNAMASNQYDKMYEFMSSRYRQKHDVASFKQDFGSYTMLNDMAFGWTCDWHKIMGGLNGATLYQYYDWPILIGPVVDLSKENGVWYIDRASWSMD